MLVKMIWIIAGMFFVHSVAIAVDQKPILDLEKTVLQEIDTICADSWCEGQYDYQFDSFKCFKDNRCILNFKMLDVSDEYGKIEIYQSCLVKSKDIVSVLDNNKNLQSDIYDQLNVCIGKREVELR